MDKLIKSVTCLKCHIFSENKLVFPLLTLNDSYRIHIILRSILNKPFLSVCPFPWICHHIPVLFFCKCVGEKYL